MAAKKARRKSGRRSALPLICCLAGALGVALVVLNLLPEEGLGEPDPVLAPEVTPETPRPPAAKPKKPVPRSQPRVEPPAETRKEPTRTQAAPRTPPARVASRDRRAGIPKVAIVIDDCGYDPEIARGFARLSAPITFAVIPHLRGSTDCAEVAFARGHEVILHQPMQPDGYPGTDPGEGALLLGMGGKQVTSILTENLSSIPHVSGLNNHMGSAATSDADLMNRTMGGLRTLRERYPGLYFLDSKTSAGTVAYDTARRTGLPAAMRSVFLDHDESLASVKTKLEELLRVAEEEGEAIGIGHVKPNTLAAIEAILARLGPDEFDFVFASELAR